MITKEACRGCREDFYNTRGDGQRCWSAESGKMVTRYRLGWWTRPTEPGAFTEVLVPSCYRQPGTAAYIERLPDFVRQEDVVRKKLLTLGETGTAES